MNVKIWSDTNGRKQNNQIGLATPNPAQRTRVFNEYAAEAGYGLDGRGIMIPETFTDGIGWIGLSDGTVRIEFVSFPPVDADGPQPKAEVRHRIIMTPQAFLRSFGTQQSFIAKLQNAGILRQLPAQAASDESPGNGAAVSAEILRPPRSPNFHHD